jgi:ribosome-associated heat shock protein Hsp15
MSDAPTVERLDKWLWQARFFKSRSRAAAAVEAGVRLNGERVGKPATPVRVGNVLTFVQAERVRVIEVLALGLRRGPAGEAQALYRDLDPPTPGEEAPAVGGGPRPTKADRRALDALRRSAP